MSVIKAGDLVRVTDKKGERGLGYTYSTYPEKPEEGIIAIAISWEFGGCSERLVLDMVEKYEIVEIKN
jgi:hypothetical protein